MAPTSRRRRGKFIIKSGFGLSLLCSALQKRDMKTEFFLFMVFAGSTSRRCLTHVSVEKHNFTLQCMLCMESAASERENQMIIWCFNVENFCSQWSKIEPKFSFSSDAKDDEDASALDMTRESGVYFVTLVYCWCFSSSAAHREERRVKMSGD